MIWRKTWYDLQEFKSWQSDKHSHPGLAHDIKLKSQSNRKIKKKTVNQNESEKNSHRVWHQSVGWEVVDGGKDLWKGKFLTWSRTVKDWRNDGIWKWWWTDMRENRWKWRKQAYFTIESGNFSDRSYATCGRIRLPTDCIWLGTSRSRRSWWSRVNSYQRSFRTATADDSRSAAQHAVELSRSALHCHLLSMLLYRLA